MKTRLIEPRTSWMLLGLTLLVSACGEPADEAISLQAAIDTVDGVTRLAYPEEGAAQLAWQLDTVALIGGVHGVRPAAYSSGYERRDLRFGAAGRTTHN